MVENWVVTKLQLPSWEADVIVNLLYIYNSMDHFKINQELARRRLLGDGRKLDGYQTTIALLRLLYDSCHYPITINLYN